MSPPLAIEASARRAGGHRWVEQRLFELLGRWAAELPDDGAAVLVGAHSRQHGAHAELWRTCLPTLPHLDPESVTVAPSPAFAAVVEAVAAGRVPDRAGPAGVPGGPSGPSPEVVAVDALGHAVVDAVAHELADEVAGNGVPADEVTLERLVGVYRVLLPRLVAAYGRRRAEASPVCDGPVMAVIDAVLAVEVPAGRAGEAVLQRLIGTPAEARRAAAYQSAVEASLVAAGGLP
jgi:hypothetical protein